ncbi:hypothetical protein C8Q77DRAFT_1062623 [Trametes polyzona]|nr:hypothetical protein C8Q77DRAFT_1062623 [Trametes polyzona]
MREHGPHLEVAQAVSIGLTICAALTPEDAYNMCAALRKIPQILLDRYTAVGHWLLEQLPYLREILPHLNNDKAAMMLFGKYVDRHARAGRANDLRTLKKNLHGWVPITRIDHPNDSDAAPLVFSPFKKDGTFDNERANWGWNSTCASLTFLHSFMEQVRCGHICMNHVGFPAFLYDLDAMDVVSSNPKDFEIGLFRGPMMISAFRCIWTSPDSATKPPGAKGKGRASISRMHGITDVTAEQIAYIACLMRHVLSSETSWDKQNVKIFDGAAFFNNIVKLLSKRRRLLNEVRDLYRL